MCGILGQFERDGVREESFLRALRLQSHRGPDNEGMWRCKNMLLGHNRLSIIDPDERSNQPMVSAEGKHVIVFNGEIYNFQTLRSELKTQGHVFCTESDTEVLLQGLIRYGTDFLPRLYGMFAFAFYDVDKSELLLARDRIGEKPLYYHQDNGRLIFASELKAVRALIGNATGNSEALLDYLAFGFVPAPKTIYREINKLEPGTWMRFKLNEQPMLKKTCRYFTFSPTPCAVSEHVAVDALREVLTKVAGEISYADVPSGAFLSGGLDSSGSVAMLKKSGAVVNPFCIGFDEKDFDETQHAKKISDHLNLNLTVRRVQYEDLEDVYDRIVTQYDEPFSDYSAVPTYYLSKYARKEFKMAVSGDGGDELFCGYDRYPRLQKWQNIKALLPWNSPFKTLSSYLSETNDVKRHIYRLGLTEKDLLYDIVCSNFKDRELDMIQGPALKSWRTHYGPRSVVDRLLECCPENSSLLQQLRLLDVYLSLSECMLVKVDRVSMMNSLEVRPFYLDARIVEFAMKLPDNLLVARGTGKFILRKTFEPFLLPVTLTRKKQGFVMPLRDWILQDASGLFKDSVKFIPEDLFPRESIARLTNFHRKGSRDFTVQLYNLMFFGRWMKHNSVSFS